MKTTKMKKILLLLNLRKIK